MSQELLWLWNRDSSGTQKGEFRRWKPVLGDKCATEEKGDLVCVVVNYRLRETETDCV
jgi:hypothetical protein